MLDATGAGWVLVEARALNDAGWIVGSGTYLGANHAFLLSPAPPPPQITGLSTGRPPVTSMLLMKPSSQTLTGSQSALRRCDPDRGRTL